MCLTKPNSAGWTLGPLIRDAISQLQAPWYQDIFRLAEIDTIALAQAAATGSHGKDGWPYAIMAVKMLK